ncbi:methyltransferase domain-containing protein [Flavobacterium sp.]|jgi:trans-aconitate methyltransferase|uniref:class I SAM-dependent methyltransferase n=1 Tax=Flavobacterium sp. TaxID=239 RepID=UPI00260B5047|nr:methyltransferase domain-containing protein [Flavobacterium sp.]
MLQRSWKNKLKWFRKRFTWNYKYAIGKWNAMGKETERYETIVDFIKKTGIAQPRILDLGCGYGALLDYLTPDSYSDYLGVDLSHTAILKAKAKKYPKANFKVADLHAFTPNGMYDVILFNEVLYYLDNRNALVAHFVQFANPNATLIVSLYNLKEEIVIELSQSYHLLETKVVNETARTIVWGIHWFRL